MNFRPIQFFALLGSLFVLPTGLAAQDHQHEQASPDPTKTTWTWTTDANVIFGFNYQQRQFADFWAWESQNWMMLSGERAAGPGRLTVFGMLSLEPWTVGRIVYAMGQDGSPQRLYAFNGARERVPLGGSPQTFQTGESYLGAPLIRRASTLRPHCVPAPPPTIPHTRRAAETSNAISRCPAASISARHERRWPRARQNRVALR